MWHAISTVSRRFILPIGAPFVVLALNVALIPLLKHETPFLLFIAAIFLSTWVGGTRAGFLATVTSVVAVFTFFAIIGGISVSTAGHVLRLTLFLCEGLLISSMIGALKRAVRTSRQRETEINSLVDGIPDYALFLLDPDGRVMTWNVGAERIKGYTATEIIGQSFARFSTPEDQAAGKPAAALRCATTVGRYSEEGWRMRKDGSRFRASVVLTRLTDPSGRLIGFTKVMHDVTEQCVQEEALRASEARFAGIVNAAMDAIISIDASQQIIVFNPAAERLFGCAASEVIGQPLDRFIPAAFREQHRTYVESFHRSGGTSRRMDVPRQITSVHADGTHLVLEVSIAQLMLDGQPIFVAFHRDIGARLAAEQALRTANDTLERRVEERTQALMAANAQLADSAMLLRRMGHMAKIGGWELDISTQAVRWSEEVYHIHGLPTDHELILDEVITYYAPDARPLIQQALATSSQDGTPWDMELPFVTKQGRSLWVRAQGEAVFEGDRIVQVRGTFQDITVRKEAELHLRTTLAERETLLKEIHHRVKNNLQVVVSLLRLQSRSVADPIAVAALHESRQRVEVMALVHELLYHTGNLSAVNAKVYVRQLSSHLAQIYTSSTSQITMRITCADIWFSLDQAVPCGLIINELLSNSFKYAFPAGRHGEIGIVLQASGSDALMLGVWDTGVGMPLENGSGRPSLGMQLVHDLTRQLHGTIAIARDSGTSITITFPSSVRHITAATEQHV